MKVILEKVHTQDRHGIPSYIFELRVGFIIEQYDYVKAAGYYSVRPPRYNEKKDTYIVQPIDGWTIHPCLQDAFDVLSISIQEMQRNGWKIVSTTKSTKTRYEFSERTSLARAKL